MKHTTCSRALTMLTAVRTKVLWLTGCKDAAGNMLRAIIKQYIKAKVYYILSIAFA